MDSFLPHHNSGKSQTHPEMHHHPEPSSSDLLSSAKFLAETATAALHHQSDKVDTGRAAGAAADIVHAASHYGKLEENSFGKYLGQAENYLHKYESSHSSTTTTADGATTTTTTTTHSSSHSGGDHKNSGSGGGYGEYLKMAEGFLPSSHTSHSGGDHGNSGSGGGYGEYLKMAEGLLQSSHSGGDHKNSGGGGYGEYLKMAEGFMKKH